MKPSFFTLFKRGKYFHPPRPGYEAQAGVQPTGTVDREVEEVERFTAAAIGFCFKHDEEFRRHFLNAVCAASGSGEPHLDVEPFRWADLLIEYADKAYVVELKVLAPLEPHQDPAHPSRPEEWSEGYGKLLTEHFRGQKTVEYVILGGSQPCGQARSGHRDGVSWRRKSWLDLAKDLPVTELTRDLADSLEVLGVPPLLIERTSKMKPLERISAFGEAAQVLYDTATKLGLDQKHYHLSVKFDPKQGTPTLASMYGQGRPTRQTITDSFRKRSTLRWSGVSGTATSMTRVTVLTWGSGSTRGSATLAVRLPTHSGRRSVGEIIEFWDLRWTTK